MTTNDNMHPFMMSSLAVRLYCLGMDAAARGEDLHLSPELAQAKEQFLRLPATNSYSGDWYTMGRQVLSTPQVANALR